METIGKIRRRHKVKGESISAIARDLNLSRNMLAQSSNVPFLQSSNVPSLSKWAHYHGEANERQRNTARATDGAITGGQA